MTRFNPAIRDELLKTIENLPLETIAQVKAFVEALLPSTKPLTLEGIKAHRSEIIKINSINYKIRSPELKTIAFSSQDPRKCTSPPLPCHPGRY